MELAVEAAERHQLVVSPVLHELAVVQHEDHVSIPDRRETVGDHDRRPADHQFVQGIQDHALGLGVDRRGRLVEDQDRRILDEGARTQTRWRSPPESWCPFSPSPVSYPNGRLEMKSWALARLAAMMTSSAVASSFP